MAVSTKPAWVVPLAICCLALVVFLIAAIIVLALIPVYLSTRDIDINRNRQQDTIIVSYASDVNDGASLTLANTNTLSTQLTDNAGLSSNNVNLVAGRFVSTTPSNGKKRQTLNGNIACDRTTGLTGNIFLTQYRIRYPAFNFSSNSRLKYKEKVLDALRKNYETQTVSISFTNGETRNVRLAFCKVISFGIISSPIVSTNCITETKNYIYVFDSNNTIYQLTPSTLNLVEVGNPNCSSGSLESISLQRNGIIWALYEDGKLYNYNIISKQCVATNYVANQSAIAYFGMAFVKSDTDNSETLYIRNYYSPFSLGIIDLRTLTLSIVGNGSNFQTDADLTGTNDGRLFGVYNSDNVTIGQINKANAEIIAQYPLPLTIGAQESYGFAAVNSDFYFFQGHNSSTDIYSFSPSTNTNLQLKNIPQIIFGATVSTCFGTS